MIEFAWPYVFLLTPLPWIISIGLPASKKSKNASLNVPDLNDFKCFEQTVIKPRAKTVYAFAVWLALIASAARPQHIGKTIEIPQTGRDIMLAVDLSGSMQVKDFEVKGKHVDRLTALKMIASDFIERRKGDRIGLILFGSSAYLQAPLTFDTVTVKQLLMEASVGLAGTNTAIGDAIGLAIKQLRENQQESRVLILLTDGKNNAGELAPEKAAEIAAHHHLKIHTIAIGAKEMRIRTLFGAQTLNNSEIDEKALKMIAEKTGGQYFRAYNTQELAQVYGYIDQLEKVEHTHQSYRPTDEVYYWPLSAALLFSGLLMGYECLGRRK